MSSQPDPAPALELPPDEIADVGDLRGHPGWAAVRQAIEARLAQLRVSGSKKAQTATMEDVRYLQGQIAAFEELLHFPDKIMHRLAARTTRAGS